MARGSKPGERRGGRQRGTPNKRTLKQVDVQQRLDDLGFDPIESMVLIAMQHVGCPTCGGAGRAKFSAGIAGPYPDPDNGEEMTCRTCLGSGYEPMAPELRGKMCAELAQYIAPKRKATEISGEGGGPLLVTEIVVGRLSAATKALPAPESAS